MDETLIKSQLEMDGKTYDGWASLRDAPVKNYKSASLNEKLTLELIRKKLSKGSIRQVTDSEVIKKLVINPIGVANIDGEKPRLTVGLKINRVAKKFGAELDHIRLLLPTLADAKFQWSHDIKSCYDTVAISADSAVMCGFRFNDAFYMATALPFGYVNAPFMVQKAGNQILRYLRTQKVDVTEYLDDFHCKCRTRQEAEYSLEKFESAFRKLKIPLSDSKFTGRKVTN